MSCGKKDFVASPVYAMTCQQERSVIRFSFKQSRKKTYAHRNGLEEGKTIAYKHRVFVPSFNVCFYASGVQQVTQYSVSDAAQL